MGTLVIACHGIGNHAEDFHEAWAAKLREVHPDGDFEVRGLWWDDLQDRIQDKYRLLSPEAAELLHSYDIPTAARILESDGYDLVREFVLDVVVYCGLADMRAYLQTATAMRLLRTVGNRVRSTVLLGHSLGAALLTHLTQLERIHLGAIGYRGMILCAPPLGIESPLVTLPDPLRLTPAVFGDPQTNSRSDVLREIAFHWSRLGDRRLHLIRNVNDLVCSEVDFGAEGHSVDLLPFLRTGFDARELRALQRAELSNVEFGSPEIAGIQANHDALSYFEQDAFVAAFRELTA